MDFNPDNPVVRYCAAGMEQEGVGQPEAAAGLFREAWAAARDDHEKAVAAHYVARHQPTAADTFFWNNTALQHALRDKGAENNGMLPSLYLNVAKGYEELGDLPNAREHYRLGLTHTASLPDDGYGQLVRNGLLRGLERVK